MIVIPAIDLRGGRAVRLVRGNPAEETEYSADPVEVAERFQEEGARRLHVVDLDAALEQGSNTDVVKAICHAVAIPVQVGGGIRSLESVGAMLEQGASRAILGTAAAARDAAFVARAVEEFAEHVVVSLDVRGGHLMTRGWTEEGPGPRRCAPRAERDGSRAIPGDGDRPRRDAGRSRPGAVRPGAEADRSTGDRLGRRPRRRRRLGVARSRVRGAS